MGETLIPLAEQEWRDPAVEHLGARPVEAPSLMTVIGLAEGEVLLHMEANGATPLRGLIRALPQPAPIVTMAIGSLIRKGLIRAVPHELEVILEPVSAHQEAVPYLWG
jgi:hypothetical protein